jgi:hypothetical protein
MMIVAVEPVDRTKSDSKSERRRQLVAFKDAPSPRSVLRVHDATAQAVRVKQFSRKWSKYHWQ